MITNPALSDLLNVANQAALEAGELIERLRNGGSINVSFKSEKDLVTNADLQAERIIIDRIKERFPDHALMTEESFPQLSDPRRLQESLWIIDPIDGTANYAHGLDHVAVAIAYAQAGTVRAAVVHSPFLKKTYSASLGGGAYCNGIPIRAGDTAELKHAIVATGYPGWREEIDGMMAQTRSVLTHCRDIRRFGSAALDVCFVASGKLDGYWESVKPWDIAAAGLIAREAGAITGHTRAKSAPFLPKDSVLPKDLEGDNFLVAAPKLFEKLKAILA